ncbi:Nitrilotriacetate monooxygenase component A [Actinomadura rubteroloni]|uniref:Nitrilotriacetate monooxygenase component A n=1 Tax=Actinomadura rubteroloni TaxID=1926885 RepID=A0A2P4UL79_9ACTN|nr:LLM class flavin-dependent oxidoreductase [Actinomadura rubteroloni]POM25802.1 Nitrilotriacetate monooxygenase component A [Actinomadura rubteroloni]
MHLNAFLMPAGHHDAAWRHPSSGADRATDVAYYQDLARTAERGRLDSVFFADGVAIRPAPAANVAGGLEPLTLLAALAVVTSRVGLIATASTTFYEPYTLARAFASLDHISGGRAGWNIVTSGTEAEARNFNRDTHLDHAVRYQRAAEFVDVANALWESWEPDAIVFDRDAGVYADPSKIHDVGHTGEHFRVRGPLNVPRSPQGRPLLVQAGSSEDGRAFAARHAEAIFTAQQTLADGQAFYRDVKARAARHGRDPRILPGICPVLGSTEEEAHRLSESLTELQVLDYGLEQLSGMLNVDLSGYPLDGPLPDVLPSEDEINGNKSRFTLVARLARREKLTIRQIIARLGGGRGHRVFAGTPEQVADELEEWHRLGAADGFNIMPPVLPTGLEDFVDHVVPLLQKRGLFRHEYESTTLRGHYGLD